MKPYTFIAEVYFVLFNLSFVVQIKKKNFLDFRYFHINSNTNMNTYLDIFLLKLVYYHGLSEILFHDEPLIEVAYEYTESKIDIHFFVNFGSFKALLYHLYNSKDFA